MRSSLGTAGPGRARDCHKGDAGQIRVRRQPTHCTLRGVRIQLGGRGQRRSADAAPPIARHRCRAQSHSLLLVLSGGTDGTGEEVGEREVRCRAVAVSEDAISTEQHVKGAAAVRLGGGRHDEQECRIPAWVPPAEDVWRCALPSQRVP